MNYINPPAEPPPNVTHKTFCSQVLSHEIGYNIYLPPGYDKSEKMYPTAYHIHGWQGNESSEIWPLEEAYKNRQAITVFINAISSEYDYFNAVRQMESIFIGELIPHIDGQYRTIATREGRMLSGFSMGGAIAFCYAVKHPELFSHVTPYAGTYHHQYHEGYDGVGMPQEKATELYQSMMQEKRHLDEGGILFLVRQNANKIRGKLSINIRIGIDDILICDNEIMHLYLDSLDIPHEYKKFIGVGHELRALGLTNCLASTF